MSDSGAPDDATLAKAAASGDRAALAEIYQRYAPELWRFSQSMLRSSDDAEDCLQDVFVVAATKLGGLREPDRLRSWLFAVARHECLARIDRRSREVPVEGLPDRGGDDRDAPATALLDSERAQLLSESISGLTARDRLVLEVADGHGMSGDEFAAALGVPRSTAYTLLSRARSTARDALAALLVARAGRADCPDLDALLGGWDGRLTSLDRKRITRHIKGCATCQECRHRVAVPSAVLGVGGVALAASLGPRILDSAIRAQEVGYVTAAGTSGSAVPGRDGTEWDSGWPPPDRRLGRAHGTAGPPGRSVRVAARVGAPLILAAAMAGGYVIGHWPTAGTAAPVASAVTAPDVNRSTITETRTVTATVTATVKAAAPSDPPASAPTTEPATDALTTDVPTTDAPTTEPTVAAGPPTRTLTVDASFPTTLRGGNKVVSCNSGSSCLLSVPDGTTVSIKNDGGAVNGPHCSVPSGGNGVCVFVIRADETVISSR